MADTNEPQFTLAPLNGDEGKAMVAKLQAFLVENKVELVVSPLINRDGTLGAKCEIFNKIELVPKAEGVVSPIQPDDLKNPPAESSTETPA